ncbi:amidase [Alkalihalobacillus sp. BA299]|uniref:amidase n=1 Tax=Alkalihalobacillus sp. BA299 TaxID=2815938 RepID=UPI001ADC09B6|nr:amidase family protein [Alkalihalobacillus sp. BA299]
MTHTHFKGLTKMTAVELSSLIKSRQVSSVEVVEAHLSRIDEINPKINAFCTVVHDEAISAAKAADKAMMKGATLGPLHGIPIALKDLTLTKGVRTTRGSRLFENFIPNEDAVLVKRMKSAGGIIIGKTNTPEFGHKGVTDNQIFGATRNPWNVERVVGGSSGGSGAAVAAGLVPIAEGSDGAGSIRIPASMCGVFGFKPTYGRVPDVLGAFSSHSPFFHNGPIARTVTDAALLYNVISGPHLSDPFSMPESGGIRTAINDSIRGLRVAYSPNLGYFEVNPEVGEVCRRAANIFRDLGCQVDEVDPGFGIEVEHQFLTLWYGKTAGMYSDLSDEEFTLLEPKVQEIILEGKKLSAVDFYKANLAREVVWHKLLEIHKNYDLLISPTTAVPAFSIDQGPPSSINGKEINSLIGWFLTYPFNLTGNPAASVPCGFSKDGLPIGLQIIGRHLEDDVVLRACRNLEQALPCQRLVEYV